ncbi:MAG: DEAD/DEAH box helicase [Pirellulaceae bacterium]
MARNRNSRNFTRIDRNTLRTFLTSFGGEHSSLAALKNIVKANMNDDGMPDDYETRSRELSQWTNHFVDAYNKFLKSGNYPPYRSYDSFTITGVYEDRTITAECRSGAEAFQLFVQATSSTKFVASCNCEGFKENSCSHVFEFLDRVTDSLSDDDDVLAQRIFDGRFDKEKPPLATFQCNPRNRILRLISNLPSSASEVDLSDELAALPPIALQAQSRVAWNVVLKNSWLEVFPILQQPKKRGDGWTKGRRIALESLHGHYHAMSVQDQAVDALICMDGYGYQRKQVLPAHQAIVALVGAPNVFFQDQPVEVDSGGANWVFRKNAQQCWLEARNALGGSSAYCLAGQVFVHIQPHNQRISISELSEPQLNCVKAVLKLPKVPLEFETDVLELTQRIQPFLDVQLPETMAGNVIEEDYRPVLLLRSQADGTLDYGIRVRNTKGLLLKPGLGRMLRADEVDGKPVQVVRSTARERHICQNISETFNLPPTMDGSIRDFEVALNLIERLQEAEETNVEILWDKSSEKPLKVLGAVSSKNVSVGITSRRDWFQLSGSCNFGSESMDLTDLLSGLQSAGVGGLRGDYVRLGDKGWAKISGELRAQFKQLHDAVNQERGTLKFDATSAPAIRSLLNEQIESKATKAWKDCLNRLEQSEKLEPVLPDSLNANLRDYQTEGFKWLRRLAEWGVGGILADDMGLGKTLQTLAVILDRAQQGPTLVIAPTSVGFNWVRESEKFAPELETHLYRETDRADFLGSVGPGSLVVCSYGLALRDAEALAKVEWNTLVLDEAQAIKNSRSKTSVAIATIPANWKVALTGTPVENHLGELWSLFRVVSPGVLGGWEQFRRRFAAPIEKDNDEERRVALRDRLKPFLLRRTKEQVLQDLPPRTEMNLYVELSKAEREMYDQVRLSAIGEVNEIAKLSDVKDQRFRILALLTRLRQLSCSPRLVHETWTERSSKLQQLRETLLELREEGHRVLVFSQFVQHLTLIREMLDEEQITYEYLDGSTTPSARQQRVDSFQNGDATAFLISLKAGGTGLNLTAADYVIHMDPWWNPAVEDQATDRAHRIGQEKPVMVYRIVSQGTIEEEILKLHDTKRDLVAGIMEGTAAAAKLSTDDLIALLRN